MSLMDGATIMTRTTSLVRLALLLAVAPLAACKDDNGSSVSDVGLGADTPLQWISPNTGGGGGGSAGDTPLQWIDPNNAVGGAGGIFVISQDEVFYDAPTPYIPGVHHPIMTATTDAVITNPELNVMAMINSIRQNLNGGGGGGVINGGIGGGANIPQLLFNDKLRKSARALCKHYVLFHSQAPFLATDPEQNSFAAGGPANTPAGRNGKGNVGATGAMREDVLADPAWTNSGNVGREFANRNPAAVADPLMRYQGVGHWRGGQFQWYWSLLIVGNVN